jgi:uncharacterized protein
MSTDNDLAAIDGQLLADRLQAWFADLTVSSQPVVVALSGGVDSAVVAKAASLNARQLIAATARSDSVSSLEQSDAEQLARSIGIEHCWVEPNELNDSDYLRNDERRCYYCKSRLYAAIAQSFPQHLILSGTNFDDLGDYRPGLQAAQEANVRAPLAELKIGKQDVRQLARLWQLSVAEKPASPCLSSRIAYGVAVTPERLARIEQAEKFLRAIGWSEFRVRLHADEMARIEIPAGSLELLIAADVRQRVVRELKRIGFRYVTLDLEGFRSGSLNAVFQIARP